MRKNLQELKSKANFYNKRAGKMAGGAVGLGLVTAAAETFALSGGMKEQIVHEMIANDGNIQSAFNWFSCNSLEGLQNVLPTLANDLTATMICTKAINSFAKIDSAAGQEAFMATMQSLPVVATAVGFAALGVGLYALNKRKAKAIKRQIKEIRVQEQEQEQAR